MKNPISVPRVQAGHERRHSSRVIRTGPATAARASPAARRAAAYQNTSPTAKSPTVTTTTFIPPSSPATPKVKRGCPVWPSMPTVPRASPRQMANAPLARESPDSPPRAVRAKSISAQDSAGPNPSATSTRAGASSISIAVANVPAMNDPTAAVASAAPALPCRVISNPSRAVITLDASPGMRTRIDVVDPPYIAP